MYKIGVVPCPSSESIQELREACDYLMIPFSEKTDHRTFVSQHESARDSCEIVLTLSFILIVCELCISVVIIARSHDQCD